VGTAGAVALTFAEAAVGAEVEQVAVVGIEPGRPGTPRDVEGPLPGPGEAIATGSGFAAGFEVGQRVTLGSTDVTVVARTAGAAFNALPTLYLPMDDYAALLTARTGSAGPVPLSYVAVRADGVSAEELADRLNETVEGVRALDRAAAVDALPRIETISRSFGVLYILLFIVVTVVTGVFFLILTVQKRRALVLLRAVGAERRDLARLGLVQVLAVVGFGVLVGPGMAIGLLAAARDTFGASLDLATTLRSGAAVLLLSLIAAGAALRRVLVIEPVEAVRPGGLA